MTNVLSDPVRLAALDASGVVDRPARPHLRQMTELMTELLDAPVSLVSMVDSERQVFVAQTGLPSPSETPLTHSFCQHVVVNDEPFVVDDARTHPVVSDNGAVADMGVIAYCGAPIHAPDGSVLGSLCAIDSEPRTWSPDEIETVRRFARVLSAELNLDRRFMQLTSDLQDRLLPHALPDDDRWTIEARYRPFVDRESIGGDFYDAVDVGDGTLVLVVGDVVGHGVDAAATMGQMRASALALARQGASPAEIVEGLDAVSGDLLGLFASAIAVVRLDLGNGEVEFTTAGAIPPRIVRPDGTVHSLDSAAGPPVGVTDRPRAIGRETVGAGDVVVLTSDGLVSRRRLDVVEGMERFDGALANIGDGDLGRIADGLLDSCCPAEAQDDDVVLLLARLD